ncbi:MAG TPA: O-antigen ligase family protein [Gaiellaceae bacterium]|nr:O-antigen ligase family protein [Gaiellaceae bacterium]
MERVELAEAAAVAGAVAAPLVLLARSRLAFAAGLALVALAEVGLALALVPDQIDRLLGSPPRLALAAVGLLALAAGAALFVRFPAAVPVVLLLASPVRVPLRLGGEEAFLLAPLYAVLVSAAVALLYRLLRGGELRAVPLVLAAPAAGYVALAGLSLLWSRDPREGSIDLFFFLFPGVVLVAVVAQALLSRPVSRGLAAVLLASTGIVAAIGLWQEWTHDLFFAEEQQSANAYESFFRVTSIFADPSIYGRYVALGIAVLLVLLWLGRVRAAVGLALMALLLAGLYFSYSQSSFVALFVAVVLVALLAGDRTARRLVLATAAAVVLSGVALVATTVDDESASDATSARWELVSVTAPVFFDNPVVGVGIGAQPAASTEEEGAERRERRNVSHTTPLTVAAELGLLGLLAYAGFLAGAATGAFLAWRREPALGLSLLAGLVILVVHSLFYSGFFEDPFVWLVLGLAAACLTAPAGFLAGRPLAAEPPPPAPAGEPGTVGLIARLRRS